MFTWRRTRDHKKKKNPSLRLEIFLLSSQSSCLCHLLRGCSLRSNCFSGALRPSCSTPHPPLPPPITTVLTLLSFQTPTNLWLYAAARTPDQVGRELRGEVAQWELCGMKQRRHPIKNQSEACASVTLQKGLWRRARSLNAGLSSELDVTWHVVFLQHFFLVLLNLNAVFPC